MVEQRSAVQRSSAHTALERTRAGHHASVARQALEGSHQHGSFRRWDGTLFLGRIPSAAFAVVHSEYTMYMATSRRKPRFRGLHPAAHGRRACSKYSTVQSSHKDTPHTATWTWMPADMDVLRVVEGASSRGRRRCVVQVAGSWDAMRQPPWRASRPHGHSRARLGPSSLCGETQPRDAEGSCSPHPQRMALLLGSHHAALRGRGCASPCPVWRQTQREPLSRRRPSCAVIFSLRNCCPVWCVCAVCSFATTMSCILLMLTPLSARRLKIFLRARRLELRLRVPARPPRRMPV